MRATRPLFALTLLVASAVPAAFAACDSSTGGLTGGPPSGQDATAPSGDDSAAPPSGDDGPVLIVTPDAGPPDTGPPPLNSVDASDIPDGGKKVTPGVVTCGTGATCNAFASNQCCSTTDAGAICQSTSVACPPGSPSLTCNESADCRVGTVCCGNLTADDAGNVGVGAACTAACAPALPQLCRTNGECPDGGPCVIQSCPDGRTYELCGVFASPPDAAVAFVCTPQ